MGPLHQLPQRIAVILVFLVGGGLGRSVQFTDPVEGMFMCPKGGKPDHQCVHPDSKIGTPYSEDDDAGSRRKLLTYGWKNFSPSRGYGHKMGSPFGGHSGSGYGTPSEGGYGSDMRFPFGGGSGSEHGFPFGGDSGSGMGFLFGDGSESGHGFPYGGDSGSGHGSPYGGESGSGHGSPYGGESGSGHGSPYGGESGSGHDFSFGGGFGSGNGFRSGGGFGSGNGGPSDGGFSGPEPSRGFGSSVPSRGGGGCSDTDTSVRAVIECTNAVRMNPRSYDYPCSASWLGEYSEPRGPLSINGELMNAAQRHSDDQARMRRMSHTGSDGSSVGTRTRRTGYSWRAVGENVAYGQRSAKEVVLAWMCSSGHRRNLMSCSFSDLGVGVNCNTGRCYYTQDFGCNGGCGCNGGGSSGSRSYSGWGGSFGGGGSTSRPGGSSGGNSFPGYGGFPGGNGFPGSGHPSGEGTPTRPGGSWGESPFPGSGSSSGSGHSTGGYDTPGSSDSHRQSVYVWAGSPSGKHMTPGYGGSYGEGASPGDGGYGENPPSGGWPWGGLFRGSGHSSGEAASDSWGGGSASADASSRAGNFESHSKIVVLD